VELIQAGGNGIFSEKNAGQILYFGIWESDLEARIKKLKEQGIGIDALIRPARDNRRRPSSPRLIRWAYAWTMSTSLRLATEAWVITGKYPL
jgi:hypothetical protein